MKFKRTLEPTQLKQFKALMRKSMDELRSMAQERGTELTPKMTKSDIIKELFQARGE